jgi:hypothetical protein
VHSNLKLSEVDKICNMIKKNIWKKKYY